MVIHTLERGWVISKRGDIAFDPSFQLTQNYIKGQLGFGEVAQKFG